METELHVDANYLVYAFMGRICPSSTIFCARTDCFMASGGSDRLRRETQTILVQALSERRYMGLQVSFCVEPTVQPWFF